MVEEVAVLDSCCEVCKIRYAVGINGADGGLSLAFDAREFESALSTSSEFARLLERWQVRGSAIHKRLLFIKKPTALQPTPSSFLQEPTELPGEKFLKQKQSTAQDAIELAGLKVHRTLQRHAWVQRVAKVVPYLLMGLGTLATIVAGIYAGQRLLDSQGERRQQTIQRVAEDAMDQQLSRQAVEEEPPSNEGLEDE